MLEKRLGVVDPRRIHQQINVIVFRRQFLNERFDAFEIGEVCRQRRSLAFTGDRLKLLTRFFRLFRAATHEYDRSALFGGLEKMP